jgi:hypothetical protein
MPLVVAGGLALVNSVVSDAQRRCRRRLAWHRRYARHYRAVAGLCRRKAASNAILGESVIGERAREYHRRRADRLPRDAERHEDSAAWHERWARLWDFLQ